MSTKSTDPTAFKPMKITASKQTEIGFELEPIAKQLTLDKMRLYRSQWPQKRNWHNDYEVAQSWGVGKPLAFASQVIEYMGEMLIKFFGEGYLGGNLSVSIIQPVFPEDTITTRGIVRDKVVEGGVFKLLLDIWCENQNGDKVIVGKASGIVQ
jgi:hypothetical protein